MQQDIQAPDATGAEQLEDRRMTLLEHLQELRLRLRNAGLVWLVATGAAAVFANDFFHFLARPVGAALRSLGQSAEIVKLSPAEAFWVHFKLALLLGLAVALPLVCWELWKFVAPGLYRRERRLAVAMTGATVLCFLAGALFGYSLLSKTAHLFLLGSGIEVAAPGSGRLTVVNMLTMEAVANFQIMLLLGCGMAFELPIVLGLLGWMGLIDARGMWRFQRYALVLSAAAAALLTPGGDAYSQMMLAVPLYVLYNVSIGLVWLIERRRLALSSQDSPLLLLVVAWTVLRRRFDSGPHSARSSGYGYLQKSPS